MRRARMGAEIRCVLQQLVADLRPAVLLFVAPIALLGLVGWALRLPPPVSAAPERLAVVNLDGPATQATAADLAEAARQVGWTVADDVATADAGETALRARRIQLLVILPPGYSSALDAARLPSIEVVTLGADPDADRERVERFVPLIARVLPIALASTVLRRDLVVRSDDPLERAGPSLLAIVLYSAPLAFAAFFVLRPRAAGEHLPEGTSPLTLGTLAAQILVLALVAAAMAVAVLIYATIALETPSGSIGPRIAVGLGVPVAGSLSALIALGVVTAVSAAALGVALAWLARDRVELLVWLLVIASPQVLSSAVLPRVRGLGDPAPLLAGLMPVVAATDGLTSVLLRPGAPDAIPIEAAVAAVALPSVVVAGLALAFAARRSA